MALRSLVNLSKRVTAVDALEDRAVVAVVFVDPDEADELEAPALLLPHHVRNVVGELAVAHDGQGAVVEPELAGVEQRRANAEAHRCGAEGAEGREQDDEQTARVGDTGKREQNLGS